MSIDLDFWKNIAAHWVIRYSEADKADTKKAVDMLSKEISNTGRGILSMGDALKKMMEEDNADFI